MSEAALQKAKLLDKKRSLEEMNLRAEAHVIELRNILDPYLDDYTGLKMRLFRAEREALERLWDEMTELKRQIEKMERDIG